MNTTEPLILGLLFEGADPTAALIRGQEIVALAEEERFSRVKHASGSFPSLAVSFCLKYAGISLKDIDIVAVGWGADKFPGFMDSMYEMIRTSCSPLSKKALSWQQKNRTRYTKEALLAQLDEHLFKGMSTPPEVRFINHHYAHACSAFLLSGFNEACIVTADGHGEEDATHIWDAGADGLHDLGQWNIPHSLGWFYTKFTQFFGFQAHDGEGKLMGLAAYGNYDPVLEGLVSRVLRLTGDDTVYALESRFFFGEFAKDSNYTAEWLELFGKPLERDDEHLMDTYYRNLAYAVQKTLEEVGKRLVRLVMAKTGKQRVCVAGGSFMNCKMNGELANMVGLDNFFAMPLAGDNGIALGAALAAHLDMGLPWTTPLRHTYLGPEFDDETVMSALDSAPIVYSKKVDIATEAAALLAQSQVVGWFQGRMEAGARALGNRSILGNPLDPKIRDIINAKVKFRELWRPFCPSATEEDGPDYFDYTGEMPFMIVACESRAGMAERIPSVVHCDNTVRVQSVSKEYNPRYHALISQFKELTGYGVVLNTSFNVKGEPIVCTPQDAVQTFLKSNIDALAIGNYLAFKKSD